MSHYLTDMFKLDFEIPGSKAQIAHEDRVFSIGSCFSDNMGEKLNQYKFSILSNPLGTIYNPYSIFKALGPGLATKGILENQGVFYHWDAHGEISALDKNSLTKLTQLKNKQIESHLKQTEWLIITFGTSIVYQLKENGRIVANCHKKPQSIFEKAYLKPKEVIDQYFNAMSQLRGQNAKIKVILTVSPVRHIRDGLHENNISKGILHHAVNEIVNQDKQAFYFPAYEIMIDELRDYRFYKPDMIHPNQQAVDYIWNKFRKSFINDETNRFIEEWSKIRTALHHRPFQSGSVKHQEFVQNLIDKIKNYEGHINVEEEIKFLQNQLLTR